MHLMDGDSQPMPPPVRDFTSAPDLAAPSQLAQLGLPGRAAGVIWALEVAIAQSPYRAPKLQKCILKSEKCHFRSPGKTAPEINYIVPKKRPFLEPRKRILKSEKCHQLHGPKKWPFWSRYGGVATPWSATGGGGVASAPT